MDVIKKLTMGVNLKDSIISNEILKLKKENIKPLQKVLQVAKIEEGKWESGEETEEIEKEKEKENRKEKDKGKENLKGYEHENGKKEYYTENHVETIPFVQFYTDEATVAKYLKKNEINVEYYNISNNLVPLRHFQDVVDYIDLLRKEKEKEKEEATKKEVEEVVTEKKKEKEKEEGKKKKQDKEKEKEKEKEKGVEKTNEKKQELIKERIKPASIECDKLLQTIKCTLRFEKPRPIQKICIPSILNGFNTICISQTGSGKTCAFLIPLLIRLNEMKLKEKQELQVQLLLQQKLQQKQKDKSKKNDEKRNNNVEIKGSEKICFVKSLIVVPTTELAFQIVEQAKLLFESYKELSIVQLQEVKELKNDADLCICTPAVLLFFLKKKEKLSLDKCRFIIFDEVDKLFEMSFFHQTHEILKEIKNKKVQKIFTTATLPGKVKNFIRTLCLNHVVVYFGKSINVINNNVKQELLYVNNEEEKLLVLHNLLKNKEIMLPVLIFVNSIQKAKALYTSINNYFSYTDVITSEKTKQERIEIFQKLKEGNVWYLICTDIMSRGIDIQGIETVINYDICYDKYNYMHRIGRACRSNRKEGRAITMYVPEDIKYMKSIVKFVKNNGVQLPDFLLNAKFIHNERKKYVISNGDKNKEKGKGYKKKGKRMKKRVGELLHIRKERQKKDEKKKGKGKEKEKGKSSVKETRANKKQKYTYSTKASLCEEDKVRMETKKEIMKKGIKKKKKEKERKSEENFKPLKKAKMENGNGNVTEKKKEKKKEKEKVKENMRSLKKTKKNILKKEVKKKKEKNKKEE